MLVLGCVGTWRAFIWSACGTPSPCCMGRRTNEFGGRDARFVSLRGTIDVMGSVSHNSVTNKSEINGCGLTYLMGPFLNEFSMFFELVVCCALLSICFDKLKEEFKPPAVD